MNMNKPFFAVGALAAVAGSIAYLRPPRAPSVTPPTQPPVASPATAAAPASGAQLQFSLYNQLRRKEGNAFFSAFSVHAALSLLAPAARGGTADEIHAVIGAPVSSGLIDDLNRRGSGGKFELAVANAVWLQKGFSLSDAYARAAGQPARLVDFLGAPDAAMGEINGWTSQQTRGKIPVILSQLPHDMRFALTNAVYFKGTWERQFEKEATRPGPFRTGKREVTVPMMGRLLKGGAYAEDSEVQVLELPYQGGDVAMLIALPKGELAPVEAGLSAERLASWRSALRQEEVRLALPRFKLETDYALKEPLSALGMPRSFSDEADFGGMLTDPAERLKVSAVIHKAVVEVNEEGTVAAAATAVVGVRAKSISPPPKVFNADHPFLFFILDKPTGTVLFQGRLVDPS